jgi:hypothetical protein
MAAGADAKPAPAPAAGGVSGRIMPHILNM